VLVAAVLAFSGPAAAEEQARDRVDGGSRLADALFERLPGLGEISPSELQCLVEDAGGLRFRAPVSIDFLTYPELKDYLREVVTSEYPPARADADARLLTALGLLEPGTDLGTLRLRLLEENIAGFYDERPNRRRLYAVSEDRRLTPMNQLVLSHELRHALQDQYVRVHDMLPPEIGDFDDRRLAMMALLEGDATLVMARFFSERLRHADPAAPDLTDLEVPLDPMPGAPDIVRDQMALPYVIGLRFVRRLWRRGGWDAVKAAWERPPQSTAEVLHPDVAPARPPSAGILSLSGYGPEAGERVLDGVLGEAFSRTLLGGDLDGAAAATAGWAGDRYEVFRVRGRTLLVWHSRWKDEGHAKTFRAALAARYARSHPAAGRDGDWTIRHKGAWAVGHVRYGVDVWLVSSDDPAASKRARRVLRPAA
jgi:hypothetical protein